VHACVEGAAIALERLQATSDDGVLLEYAYAETLLAEDDTARKASDASTNNYNIILFPYLLVFNIYSVS
jgi:hypothetical protein